MPTAFWGCNLSLLPQEAKSPWDSSVLSKGVTKSGIGMSCHISRLSGGAMPHPPHQHTEEEIVVLLSGKLEVSIGAEIEHPQAVWPVFPGSNRILSGRRVAYPSGNRAEREPLSRVPVDNTVFPCSSDRGSFKGVPG